MRGIFAEGVCRSHLSVWMRRSGHDVSMVSKRPTPSGKEVFSLADRSSQFISASIIGYSVVGVSIVVAGPLYKGGRSVVFSGNTKRVRG